MIAGILLAAGAAKRMGRCKQLLPLGGRTLLWQTASAVCHSLLEPVVLVTGAQHEQVSAAVRDLRALPVFNPCWQQGQAGSLKAGLQALPPEAAAVMFLLADQPLVTPELINGLIALYRSGAGSIVAPEYHGRRGNPTLFDLKTWKQELLQLQGDAGARRIIAAHPECVASLSVESENLFFDADTEEDYKTICELFMKKQDYLP